MPRSRRRAHVLLLRLTRTPRRITGTLLGEVRARRRRVLSLDTVHRRLELLLAAMYGRAITIDMPERRRRSLSERLVKRARSIWQRAPQLAMASSGSISLPETLSTGDALARYRLLAVEQAERLVRGTPDVAHLTASPLERDLFLLAESAAAEAAIARRVPGLRSTLASSRAEALAQRPSPERLGALERSVEVLVRRVLSSEPSALAEDFPTSGTASDSLAWARATAQRLSASHDSVHYHGVKPVPHWGKVRESALSSEQQDPTTTIDMPSMNMPGGTMSVNARTKADDGASQSSAEADAPAPLAAEDLASAVVDPYDDAPAPADSTHEGEPGIPYDEWDHEAGHYISKGVMVRLAAPKDADERWSLNELAAHAAVVRRVRQRFERLRARRVRLDRQRDGEELDIASCVRALVDRRAGLATDDRLYASVRPARRALAIVLLVDISGSTDAKVDDTRRIIDVERTSLLVASEALDALGDRYAIVTFSGRGARDVRLTTIKGFAERNGELVRRRIAGLEPQGNTRFGAAVRHATRLLSGQPAGHHLLLILSDGRPNDVDGYHEEYGVADTRQAINEARAQGVYPFCLTVDRDAAEYLPHIFGIAGHSVLRDPRQLPLALVKAVQQLLRS